MTLVESSIDLYQDEDRLFESVLNVNFLKKLSSITEAENENTEEEKPADTAPAENNDGGEGAEQTEENKADNAAKTGIITRIKEIIGKAVEAIKKAIPNLFNKIREIVLKDSTIVKKYREALLTKGTLKGFEGIEDFAAPNPNFKVEFIGAKVKKFYDDMLVSADSSNYYGFVEDEKFLEELKKDTEETRKEMFFEKADKWVPGDDYNFDALIKSYYNYTKSQMFIEQSVKAIDETTRKTLEKVEKVYSNKASKEGLGDDDAQKLGSRLIQTIKPILEANKDWFKAARKVLVVCGSYAVKHVNEAKLNDAAEKEAEKIKNKAEAENTEKQESAILWLAGLSSDEYVNEQFAFI